MNLRFRLLIILVGALLVAAVFTFPVWFPLTLDPSEVFAFPELPEELRDAFDALPPERREAYLALRGEDVRLAVQMAGNAVREPRIVPDEQQANPQRSGQVAVREGEFVTITPIRGAEGKVTLYEMPDGSRYLWLEEFSVIPGPGLRLFLSPLTAEAFTEMREDDTPADFELSLNELLLDPLRFDVGSQAYEVPSEAVLDRYNSVLIYSTELDLLYSFAEWTQ